MKIDLMILAAGNSRRFHGNKLLSPYQGKPLILHTLDKVKALPFRKVVVVSQYPTICSWAQDHGYFPVINPDPDQGIASSMHHGMDALPDSEAILFLVGDLPDLKPSTLQQMLLAAKPDKIIAAYDGEIKNPMLFPKRFFAEIRMLQGDQGAKKAALRHKDAIIPILVDPKELLDIDERNDLNRDH